jgi:hypothetical protein
MRHLRSMTVVLALFMTACGGGGGGASGTDPGSGEASTSTGLVPAAPETGATLHANAADLRPLIDGAVWRYRGIKTAADGSPLGEYTSAISQKSSGGSLQETESQVFADAEETSPILLSGGSVVTQVKDPLGVGSNEVVSMIELRSPVRINDQYTLFERRNMPTDTDVDGDGKTDVADLALFSRVIGNESVALPELSRTVTAVKIETTALLRIKRSSNGTSMPVSTLLRTQWYAPGIGVVRRKLSEVSTPGNTGSIVYDERLTGWDGITQGLGALPPVPASVPNANTILPTPLAATSLGDRVLVLAESMQPGVPGDLTLAVFDKRGVLLSTKPAPGLGDSRNGYSTPKLFRIDTNTALLAMPAGDAPGTIRLQRVDASGTLQGSTFTLQLPTHHLNLPAAWDGESLWVAWLSISVKPGSPGDLMLQPFSANGEPLAPAQRLEASNTGDSISSVALSAAAGRLLMTWARTDVSKAAYRYAMVQGRGAAANVRTLGTVSRFTSPQPPVLPVIDSGVAALQWSGPVLSYASGGPLPDTLPRGLLLDVSGNPLRSTEGSLDDERLPASWVGPGTRVLTQALGDRLVVSSFVYQRPAPELNRNSDFLLTSFVQPGSRPWAAAAATATSLASASGTLTNIDQFGLPAFVLLWEDRALVIGDNFGRTMTNVFWLR